MASFNEMKYYISLGSNLGRKRKNLETAYRKLAEQGIKILRASSVYKTAPVDFLPQPWFYNQVLEVEAPFSPLELLVRIQAVEKTMKRLPAGEKGPRVIDIDILLAGQSVIRTRKLVIPHPRMNRRNFVLIPLFEIAPDTVHPICREKVSSLLKRSGDRSEVRIIRSAGLKTQTAERRNSIRRSAEYLRKSL